ncbi:MAG: helix-turn-helix transcriptional regulator [Clostridia bacterium]|nr:helix-turn-helix transcriptional regulator [Clostridia bacterium]
MAAKKVGTLIKEARTKAGLTQDQLAKKISGLTAADISRAERGEKELTQDQLKAIAKLTGVTQKSLLDAAKAAVKPAQTKPAAKPASGKAASVQLTADEKRLIALYRKADDKTKTAAADLLNKGVEQTGTQLLDLLGSAANSGSGSGSLIGSLLGGNNNNNNNNNGSVGANLLGALLGGGNSGNSNSSPNLIGSLFGGNNNNNNSNAGANLLGSLIGSALGSKREMPGEDDGSKDK